MVAGRFLWFQAGISWFFMVLGRFFMGVHGSRSVFIAFHGSGWVFMVPGWFFMVSSKF